MLTVGLLLAGSSLVCAQSTGVAPTTAPPVDSEEIISLSAFEVNADSDLGYTATSAMAGGRIDTLLKDTPAAVTIMTQEFMEDAGIINFVEAAEWAPNAIPLHDDSDYNDFNVNVRGIGFSYPTRNYFRWYVASDGYNTERLEFARGPNSILFGDGNPGGISTTWTKQARFHPISKVQMRVSNYGGYRISGDYNQPVSDSLALRINVVNDRLKGWRDGDKPRRDGIHLAATYRLSERTQIRAEFERGKQRRYVPSNYLYDQVSRWNGTTVYDGVTAPPSGGTTGTGRMGGNNDYWVMSANGGLQNWRGFYQTAGTNLTLLPEGRDIANFPTLPSREFNVQSPDAYADNNYKTWTLYVEQQVTDNLIAQFAYNYQNQSRKGMNRRWQQMRLDLNQVLPDGSPNPKFGKAFSDVWPQEQLQSNELNDYRLSLVYRKEWDWLKESISFMSGFRQDHYNRRMARPGRTDNPANTDPIATTNRITVRQYWDEPTIPALLGNFSTADATIRWIGVNYAEERQSIQYNQLASMSKLFRDRLTVVLGYRYDAYKRRQQRSVGRTADGTQIIGATDGPGATDVSNFETDTKTAGLVFFPVPWMGLYGNYSETFTAAGNGPPTLTGGQLPLAMNEGIDVGVKMEFFDGKISGSIGYYKTDQVDRARGGDDQSEINDIWNLMGRSENVISSYRDTDAYRAHGYELDLTANLTKNWRLMFNYALPETEQVNIGPGLRAYYAEHLATWQSALTDTNIPEVDRDLIATNISTIDRTIQGYTEGRALNNTFDYVANLYTTYSFRDGALKGFGIGGGANIRGQSVIGNTPGAPFDYLYSSSYVTYSANLTYRHKFGDTDARFQINVANLFDNEDLRFRSYARTGGVDYPNNFIYIPPRRIMFTATFTF